MRVTNASGETKRPFFQTKWGKPAAPHLGFHLHTYTSSLLFLSFSSFRSLSHLFYHSTGQTCVHLAASSGNRKLLEYLKELGANFNLRVRNSAKTLLLENSSFLSSGYRKVQRDGHHCMLLYLASGSTSFNVSYVTSEWT